MALIILHYFDGVPLQDIADLLQIPIGTINKHLSVAHRQLRGQHRGSDPMLVIDTTCAYGRQFL